VNVRYQVFVSSTFRDLREERQAALEGILELGHFPAGMETFPAADDAVWELIKSVIETSDYYVLVIGGKYGSTGSDGISYTEKEYEYAKELGKPILAFLHASPDDIPAGRSELEPDARRRLDAFRARVTTRHCKFWNNKAELKAAIVISLIHAIRTKPVAGWIRNEGPERGALLERLATLQAQYDALAVEAADLKSRAQANTPGPSFPSMSAVTDIAFRVGAIEERFIVALTWAELFNSVGEKLLTPCREFYVGAALRPAIFGAVANTPVMERITSQGFAISNVEEHVAIEPTSLAMFLHVLLAEGLVEPVEVEQTMSAVGRVNSRTTRGWVLTPKGRLAFARASLSANKPG
jgi:hypothetical protein